MMTDNLNSVAPPPPPPPLLSSMAPTCPPPPYLPGAAPANTVKSGQSIAALVLGCCSIVFYFTLIVPVLAIIFASVAMRAQREAGQRVNGMAVAGLVLGLVFSFFGVMFVLYVAAA